MASGKEILRAQDVAWILDCSPDDVLVLARSGKLKATKVGKFWRFRLQDVIAYKRQNRKPT